MNKKSLLLTLLLVIISIISIYISSEYLSNKKKQLSTDLVTMKVKEDTITSKSATFTLKSHKKDSLPYIYGEDYYIEKKENDDWSTLVPIIEDFGFNDIGFTLFGGDEREIEVVWEWLYGDLPIGEYRIVKSIFLDSDIDTVGQNYIEAEFIIK